MFQTRLTRRQVFAGAAALSTLQIAPRAAEAAIAANFKAIPKAMWVNQVTIDKIGPVIDYANAIGCKTLYYGIGANSGTVINGMKTGQPAAAFTKMTTYKNAGGRIWLMGGNTDWLTTPGVLPTPITTYRAVMTGNVDLFQGIHLDVEPWGLSTWSANKQALCAQLETFFNTVKTGRPAGSSVSAFMTGQTATVMKPTTSNSYLKVYADMLNELAMGFYYNTLTADTSSTEAARAILAQRNNWWFGQNTIKSTTLCPRDGSWADVSGITSASFQSSMVTLWNSTAKPSKARGLAFYNDSFSTCNDATKGKIQGMPVLVPSG